MQASSPAKKLNAGVTCIKFSFYRICLSLLALAFLISGHGLRFCEQLIGVTIVYLSHSACESVACFVLSNWMDVDMNIIILRLHLTRGSPNNICLVANAWYNCSTRYDMRSEFGISARESPSGKKWHCLLYTSDAADE